MKLKAQVREGRLVLDEPTDLPEGTEVELTQVFDDDLGPEERQALEASLARSAAQLARDELVDARGSTPAPPRLAGEGADRPVHSRGGRSSRGAGLGPKLAGVPSRCTA